MKLEFRILSMGKVVVIANKIIILNPENEENWGKNVKI